MNDEQFKYMEQGEDFEEEIGKLEISYIWCRQKSVQAGFVEQLRIGVMISKSKIYWWVSA